MAGAAWAQPTEPQPPEGDESELGELAQPAPSQSAGDSAPTELDEPPPAAPTEESEADPDADAEPDDSAVSEAMAAWDAADDDDWDDDSGELDRTPHLSGVLQASYRATFFSDNALPVGNPADDRNSFQIEHTHVKLSGDLSHELSWEVMPCLTHMNDFSVITANFDYGFGSGLHLVVGRFLLPFGQFNLRSLPGTYSTVSRPLLYQSHEDGIVVFENATPQPFLFTPRDDLGLQAYGSVWFAGDSLQLSYAASVTNGLRPESSTMARFWNDNNQAKQAAGRVSLGYFGDRLSVAGGGSLLWNEYHDELDQLALGADAEVMYRYAQARQIEVRAEFVRARREIMPNDELLEGTETTEGFYATAEVDATSWLAVYYGFDWLRHTRPRVLPALMIADVSTTLTRHLLGANLAPLEMLVLRLEYGFWDYAQGAPDAHGLSAQTVVTF